MSEENIHPDSKILIEIVTTRMPFGKFQGRFLDQLPVSYLEWMARTEFRNDKLGMLLATIYEIKINGLDDLLRPLRSKRDQL